MSILTEAKKEHKKLVSEITERQQRLKVLESLIEQYGASLHPSTVKLYETIIECLRWHDGHASFADIVECLIEKGFKLSRPKISILLTRDDRLLYDKKKKEWELVVDTPAAK